MHKQGDTHLNACESCRNGSPLDFDFTMAFQPIVDIIDQKVFAYEALVRGVDGSGAASILSLVTLENRYRFDQACRIKAVQLAARLGVECLVSINFLPNAIYEPSTCIRATLAAAAEFDFPTSQLMFEISESEDPVDKAHLKNIVDAYGSRGFTTAIDDFGSGYANLGLLVEFQPDYVKLNISLLRGIDGDPVRQAVVRSVLGLCESLKIGVIAEGIETVAEYQWFKNEGVRYAQGYLFARPAIEQLPEIVWP